ncbi:MAG: efflux RND transporter periplasmic adaptor subunit [Pseudomonadota bacterium]
MSAFLCIACTEEKKDQALQAKAPAKAAPVGVAVAVEGPLDLVRYAIGTVRASSTVGVRSRVMGELTEIHFVEGQDVQKGQALFSIDPRPAEAALLVAKANVERSRAELAKAEDDLRRYKPLVKDKYVSQEQYDQVLASAKALRASLKADEAAVISAELELSYCSIISPVTARAGGLEVHVGNIVKANADEALVTLDTVEPVYVDFSVPEQFLPAIMQQQKVQAPHGAMVMATAEGGSPMQGYVDLVSNAVDATTGTIALRALFANEDRNLWPGQFVNVELSLGQLENVITVPTSAIQHGIAGSYVYVVSPENTADFRIVTVGAKDEGRVEVRSGVHAGERVVVEGFMRLRPDALMEVKKLVGPNAHNADPQQTPIAAE